MKHRSRHKRHESENPLEALVYEIKPYFYLGFAAVMLKMQAGGALWVKYSLLGILGFGAYVTYSRLRHRGLIR